MTDTTARSRLTSFAPQFLVDDLARSIAFYQRLGFTFGEPWEGVYAIGQIDGLELHLKEAPKNAGERSHRRSNEHLDAAAGVDGIEAFYARCAAIGATIIKPLTTTPWGTKDFYVEDPDGYVLSFGGRPAADASMIRPEIAGVSPFFIVQDTARALAFYRDRLGFEITFQEPADDPFFAIVRRGGAMIMLKNVGVDPLPNYRREPAARWDAYLDVPDPDALATEFASRHVAFSKPLKDTHDGLRGFELADSDGYILFFGRPR